MPKTGSSKGKEDPNVKYSFDWAATVEHQTLDTNRNRIQFFNYNRTKAIKTLSCDNGDRA